MYLCITMESYCLKCGEYTKNINPQVSGTSNGKLMILSKCAKCKSKKSKFINKQEAKGLLSNLGIKTPLRKVPILGDILFWMNIIIIIINEWINEIVNKYTTNWWTS